MLFAAVQESASGRYCCKSLFALMIKNSAGCRHGFRVKMWGTSSPDDKRSGDLGNVIERHRSAVVGWIVLRRKIYHRAILNFCNSIGSKRTFRGKRVHVRFRSEADIS